ncbi:MAG: hypothetical protein EZS28_009383, partial [Streblomastix strix]
HSCCMSQKKSHQLYGDNKNRKVKDSGKGALTNDSQAEDGFANQTKEFTPEVAAAFVEKLQYR